MNVILLISDTFRYDNLFDRAAAAPGGIPVRTPKLDAYCENNVASDHADVVKELHRKLADWLKEIDAPKEAIAPFK